MRKLIIIGEGPNPQGKVAYETQTGKRLAEWIGCQPQWYNLNSTAKWHLREARENVRAILDITAFEEKSILLLLGKKVCKAFGWDDPIPLRATVMYGRIVMFIPHPSGLNRWYNDEQNLEVTKMMLSQIGNEKTVDMLRKALFPIQPRRLVYI